MHTIGAFAVIFDEGNRVLLCHRTDRDMWNLPGGRVEPHESPWAAAAREVEEEVGLLVRVERLLGVYSIPERTDLVLNFLCVVAGGALRISAEADDIRWFERSRIPGNTSPATLNASKMHTQSKIAFACGRRPNLAVNTDAPSAALRAGHGSPVTLIR